ncbi:hypothetical protein BDV96DRAFT_602028 [Lophiotrema nucula]|uniref:Uncharacterized protein n=1 Tax=Lophiotrema nucula TaxID=690887 RepID=A0A6A5Z1A7_9PLEO|nr:hypothetical protein BDV96DRAFT_602028 [Lophiotrema nucula]
MPCLRPYIFGRHRQPAPASLPGCCAPSHLRQPLAMVVRGVDAVLETSNGRRRETGPSQTPISSLLSSGLRLALLPQSDHLKAGRFAFTAEHDGGRLSCQKGLDGGPTVVGAVAALERLTVPLRTLHADRTFINHRTHSMRHDANTCHAESFASCLVTAPHSAVCIESWGSRDAQPPRPFLLDVWTYQPRVLSLPSTMEPLPVQQREMRLLQGV